MTEFDNDLDAAIVAANGLAIDLLQDAASRYRREELEDYNDFQSVFELIDDMAHLNYGEGLRPRVLGLLEQAGIDLPLDPEDEDDCEETDIVLGAVLVACDELAQMHLAAMPHSLEDALRLATARAHYERESLCPTEDGNWASLEHAAIISDWLEGISPHFPLVRARLLALGLVVMRDGHLVLPSTAGERSEACHAFEDHLLRDVQKRLTSYCSPFDGPIVVRQVALTAKEEAIVRTAARRLHAAEMSPAHRSTVDGEV